MIGPTSWNTYCDAVLKVLIPEEITTTGYAEDIGVLIEIRGADKTI